MAKKPRERHHILFVLATVFSALFGLLLFAFSIQELMQSEYEKFMSRYTIAKTYVSEASAVLEILHSHMASSLDGILNFNERSMLSLPVEWEEEPSTGIFEILLSEGTVRLLGSGKSHRLRVDFHELMTLMMMSSMFQEVIDSRMNIASIYYISVNQMMLIAPTHEDISSQDILNYSEHPFWIDAQSTKSLGNHFFKEHNSSTILQTFYKPVYVGSTFRGVFCADMASDQFHHSINSGHSLGQTRIINKNEQPIRETLEWVLDIDADVMQKALRVRHPIWDGGNFVFSRELFLQELHLVHTVNARTLVLRGFMRGLPVLILLVALNFLLYFFLRIKRRFHHFSVKNVFFHRLLSIIGHDLSTPLGVCYQSTEIINPENCLEIAKIIQKSTQSTIILLQDLTNWGTRILTETKIKPEPTSIQDIISNALTVIRSQAKIKNISISTHVDSGVIYVDKNALTTVLRNILSNAVKFTSRDKTIYIEVNCDADKNTTFIIQDSGIGMTPQQIENFMQRKPIEKRLGSHGEKGSGIGLSLIAPLCDNAGWTISISLEHPPGTRFSIYVPQND